MDIVYKLAIYIICIGFSIITAYKLGFGMGEDRGRKDMQNFMMRHFKP